ncbi:hypothetical protein RIF29_42204 [Crotalaria pallida]|uniref:Uncharacterized protein n=1 Tax=Crotalaria pallida TaxID=3830 RepID=A0AAN9HW31_CROPI
MLCNACGTRYQQHGSFKNYLPKHCNKEHLTNLDQNVKVRNNHYNLGNDTGDLWDFKIPSRKRSRVVYEKITPMERFHKQLQNMLIEMRANEASPEEDVLLYNTNNFIPSNEIGIGCSILFIKPDGSST